MVASHTDEQIGSGLDPSVLIDWAELTLFLLS